MFEYVGIAFVIIVVALGSRAFQRSECKSSQALLMKNLKDEQSRIIMNFLWVIREIDIVTVSVFPGRQSRKGIKIDQIGWKDNKLVGDTQGIGYEVDLSTGKMVLEACFANTSTFCFIDLLYSPGFDKSREILDLVRNKKEAREWYERNDL